MRVLSRNLSSLIDQNLFKGDFYHGKTNYQCLHMRRRGY